MSDDRTAAEAHGRLNTHEAVCAERYKNLDHSLNELKAMLLAQGGEFSLRLNAISNRMWVGVTAVLGASVVGLATMAFYLMTKGHS
jgi:hypothetical protein